MALLLCTASITNIMVSCDSYERRIERLSKVASEFKATLSPDNQILAERIDSTVQKVFYLEPDKEGYGDVSIKNIKVHDYTTNETKSVLPESGSIEDFEFCGIEYKDSKVIKDRLFIKLQSDCMWRLGSIGVFYVNARDNTLHYVETCDDATFLENGEIVIRKFYYLGEDDEEYGGEKTEMKEYTLSTSLSDEAYAYNRQEQKRTEERLAEEWRRLEEEKRLAEERRRLGVERIIKIDYSILKPGFEDYAGTLRGRNWNNVYTKTIIVPNGKVWQLKDISYFGYSESNPPRFYYCKNVNGAFDIGLKEFENGQILYPWGYTFWIMLDNKQSESGRLTAEMVFMEKEF